MVARISDEVWQFTLHFRFIQSIKAIELFPELFVLWLCSVITEFNASETHSVKDFHGSFETVVVAEMIEFT